MEKLRHQTREALTKVRANYPHVLAFSLMFLLIFVVYWRDLEILVNEALYSEALSHILLIPFFVGFLFYQKRDMFKASLALDKLQKQSKVKYVDELVGLSLCLTAFLLYWYGSYTFYPLEYHLLSLPIFVLGVMLFLFNLRTLKVLVFPILFLLFLIPLPSDVMYTLGGALANLNTQIAYTLLKFFGLPVTLSTSYGAPTIELATSAEPIPFTIDLPCSGIYTFIAFVMFAAFLAFIISTSVSKKVTIFILGFFIFEILNILRITTIVSVAHILGKEIAMSIFHTVAGILLTFIGMLFTLFLSEKFLKIKFLSKTTETRPCPKCKTTQRTFQNFCLNCGRFFNPLKRKPSQIFWAKLIILLLGCSIIALSINAPTFAITQGTIEVTSTWENATNILPNEVHITPTYTLHYMFPPDVEYAQIAKQDVALTYLYLPENASNLPVYVLVNVANSISNLHSWEVCLISWQTAHGQYPLVSVLDSRDIQLLEDVPIIARYLVFKTPENYTQVTLYWYERATFKTGVTVQQKYVRISLVILTGSSANYQHYESLLLDFGRTIASYWQPLKSQSLISLGIPAQQTLLILSLCFIMVAKTTQYANDWRKRTNNLKIFNNLASSEDKLVLQTISKLNKEKRVMTTRDINLAIKRKVGKFMKFEMLVSRLNHLQEYGFIKRDLASNNNKPMLVWKSLVNI
jgi:exosortase